MIDPAPPPQVPQEPTRELSSENYGETLRQLQAPFDAMAPTLLMSVCLAISLTLFLGLVCFVAYNDYERTHSGDDHSEENERHYR